MPDERRNSVQIDGILSELQPLRRTPAGVPVLKFRIEHRSRQMESGLARGVELELDAVAVGDKASLVAAAGIGRMVRVSGFLAARSLRSRMPELHIDTIEFLEGNSHGFQARPEAQG